MRKTREKNENRKMSYCRFCINIFLHIFTELIFNNDQHCFELQSTFIVCVKLYSVKGCTSRWHGWCWQLLWYSAENLSSIAYINSKVHVLRHFNLDGLICVFQNVRCVCRHVFLAYCSGGLLTSNSERTVDLVNGRLNERRFHLRGVETRLGGIVKVFFCGFPIHVNGIDGFVPRTIRDAHSWRHDWSEIRCRRFDIRVVVVASVFRYFGFFLAFVRRDSDSLAEVMKSWMFARRARSVQFPWRTICFKRCES